MDDLISRQAAIDALERGAWGKEWDKTLAKAMIESVPSAQPERKKGKWIRLDKDNKFFVPHMLQCSECGNILDKHGVNAGRGDANYCPNCGSYNRGLNDEAD